MSIRGIAVFGYGEGNKEDEIATAFFKRFAMTLLLEVVTFAMLTLLTQNVLSAMTWDNPSTATAVTLTA